MDFSKMTLSQKAEYLKQNFLNGEEVIRIMQFIGYEFNREGFTSLRAEKTPSVKVRRDGYIKDFGSGWGGDIFALLQDYKGMRFNEAIEYIAKVLNVKL